MNTFATLLERSKGNLVNARREYIRERRWRGDEWYEAWPRGLAVEVEAAVRSRARPARP